MLILKYQELKIFKNLVKRLKNVIERKRNSQFYNFIDFYMREIRNFKIDEYLKRILISYFPYQA